jgi:hypothetical protein
MEGAIHQHINVFVKVLPPSLGSCQSPRRPIQPMRFGGKMELAEQHLLIPHSVKIKDCHRGSGEERFQPAPSRYVAANGNRDATWSVFRSVK